ncbi:DUF2793 domain-containing protein [Paenibacillus sp. GCM10012307]|uniref:DUF2793 domain-containing protein n=1 Tax=Paenibacillus roseus TaxID=2798579 RepID=A0A934J0F1_9BACL|nr:DUF2793 domain-containing protein [Paenibacillus roseus]MBJ6360435.1 DUF2793 domain-containing protein [Paenibacillus roseus]
MAQTIRIRRGTKAQLDAFGKLSAGELGFCTDTKEIYIGDGSDNILAGRAMSGVEASRPNSGVSGRMYYVTSGSNAGYIYVDDGSAWRRISAQKLTDLTGTLDDITDGTNFAKVKKADITAGSVNKVSDGTNTKTAAEIKTHIDDAAKHRQINDTTAGATSLWSSQKTNTEISNAIRGLDWQDSVGSCVVATPPASPQAGYRWIIPASATGAWAGKTNQIAHWSGTGWIYYEPKQGWSVYVHDENKNYVFNSTAWVRSGEANQTIIAGNGLTGGGQGDTITLTVGGGNGITVAATGVSAKAGKGIVVNGTGIEANIDQESIVYDSANGSRLTVAVVDGGTF